MAEWLDSTRLLEKDTIEDTRRTLMLSLLKVVVVDVVIVVISVVDLRMSSCSLTNGRCDLQENPSSESAYRWHRCFQIALHVGLMHRACAAKVQWVYSLGSAEMIFFSSGKMIWTEINSYGLANMISFECERFLVDHIHFRNMVRWNVRETRPILNDLNGHKQLGCFGLYSSSEAAKPQMLMNMQLNSSL